jgi:prepilin-type N-terminal cleavage/methylation domain-containing protein
MQSSESGFSLMEVIVATVIATIAVLGLAHTFGAGRAYIDRSETARDAQALVQRRLETLVLLGAKNPGAAELVVGGPNSVALAINAHVDGTQTTQVDWVDDPIDKTAATGDGNPNDYKRVTVTISWIQGGTTDQVVGSRVVLK